MFTTFKRIVCAAEIVFVGVIKVARVILAVDSLVLDKEWTEETMAFVTIGCS